MRDFRSPADVMSAACDLQDRLGFIEETEAAETIGKAVLANYATTTQSLAAIAAALSETRPAVRRTLDDESLVLLDAAVAGANDLMEPAQQNSMWRSILARFKH